MCNKLVLLAAVCAAPVLAQSRIDPQSTLHITFPGDSPLSVLAANWGESSLTPRGGALLLDLRTSLRLRNSGKQRIRAVTLQVQAQETTPGGRGSTTVANLDVGPGEVFDVQINQQLLRPLANGTGPMVEIGLDGVLFSDLDFYGPNKLNSRRLMTTVELEARRDRRYWRDLLDNGGPLRVQREMQASIARIGERRADDLHLARAGRATAMSPEHQVNLAMLDMRDAPVFARNGSTQVAGDEVRGPRLELQNRSDKTVSYVELGWIVKERSGAEKMAGVVPAQVTLHPGQAQQVFPKDYNLRVARQGGARPEIDNLSTFVNSVEFSDGKIWIPNRVAVSGQDWTRLIAPSPEEMRLAELYKAKGLDALIEELRRFSSER